MSIIKGKNQIVAGFGGTKENIGDVKWSYSKLATDNSGRLPLFTGETITSANTIYPEFYNWILVHTELQCTSEEYESALTTYGECAKYVIGKIGDNATAPDYGTTTIAAGSIRLPLIKNYIKAANPSEGIKNIEAGLPNIEGRVFQCEASYNVADGAFYNGGATSQKTSNGAGSGVYVDFNASRSSSVYGKSDTVTPASTTLYPWVVAYAAAIPASTAQAAEFQQGLSGKADTNLGNTTPSQSFKEMSVGWGMPDYSAGVSLSDITTSNPYTAPADGYLYCTVYNCIAYVNNSQVAYSDFGSNSISVVIILSKNDIVTVSKNSLTRCNFYPCKGV